MRRVTRMASCQLVVACVCLASYACSPPPEPQAPHRCDRVRRGTAHYGRRQRRHRELRIHRREHPFRQGRPPWRGGDSGRSGARRPDGQDRHAGDGRSPRPPRIPERGRGDDVEGDLHARESHRPSRASRLSRGERRGRRRRPDRAFGSARGPHPVGRCAAARCATRSSPARRSFARRVQASPGRGLEPRATLREWTCRIRLRRSRRRERPFRTTS